MVTKSVFYLSHQLFVDVDGKQKLVKSDWDVSIFTNSSCYMYLQMVQIVSIGSSKGIVSHARFQCKKKQQLFREESYALFSASIINFWRRFSNCELRHLVFCFANCYVYWSYYSGCWILVIEIGWREFNFFPRGCLDEWDFKLSFESYVRKTQILSSAKIHLEIWW